MSDLERMQAAYDHFTLEEWEFLVQCVDSVIYNKPTSDKLRSMSRLKIITMLIKFPSAVL